MDYHYIDPETHRLFLHIRKKIHTLQNWGFDESIKKLHLNIQSYNGASFPSLKELACSYKPNEKLAFLLWSCRKREEQIVACFLFPQAISRERLIQYMKCCDSYEIAEYIGSIILAERKDLPEFVKEWSHSDNAFFQVAAITGAARNRILHKSNPEISDSLFQSVIHKPYKDKYVKLVSDRYK